MKKLLKICEFLLFFAFFILIFFLKSKLSTFLIIPVLFFLYFFYKKEKIKNYELFLLITAFAIRFISLFLLKVEITDDFKTMYEASLSLLKGNLDFMNGFYFRTYPFQLGLTLYQAILLKILPNPIILKLFNSVFTSFIVVYLYKIIKLFMDEKIARVISLGYLFYLYPLYLNSVLTNQHIPALLMLITIYLLFTKKENYKNAVVIAVLLGIANFFRTESIIFILAIIVFYLIQMSKDTWKQKSIFLGIILLAYFSFTTATTFLIQISPLNTKVENAEILDKNVTLWKFYCGLSVEHNGLYNVDDQEKYFNSNDEVSLLKERIQNDKWKFPLLFLKKEVILWTQTNYDLRILNTIHGFIYQLLLNYNQGYLNFVILLLIISLYPKKEEERKEILFIKIFIGIYYFIYMFIEISPRYAYNLHLLVFLLLSIGLERIIAFSKKKGLL